MELPIIYLCLKETALKKLTKKKKERYETNNKYPSTPTDRGGSHHSEECVIKNGAFATNRRTHFSGIWFVFVN